MGNVVTYGFKGMHNLPLPAAKHMDDARMAIPRMVLNADVLDDGVAQQRGGFKKLFSLPGAHSVWHGERTLCVATGASGAPALFQVGVDSALELALVGGPSRRPMEYLEAGVHVYLSNGFWKGRYDLAINEIEGWGLPLPLDPEITQVEGNLPPGTFKLCYTNFARPGRLSGSGPVAEITFAGGTAGIKCLNRPAMALAWITEPNGSEFYLAPIDGDDVIRKPYYSTPLPTFGVIPPPPLTCLTLAFGRAWGANGKGVYYSDPFKYEQFRADNYFPFPEDITMIAAINDGLFVNSLDTTWLLKGTTPAKMTPEKLGHGAIPGTLGWTMAEGGAYDPKKSRTVTPIWFCKRGIVIGRQSGVLVFLTQDALRTNIFTRGAATSRLINGIVPQTIFSLTGNPRGDFDDGLHEVFERGRIFIPAPGVLSTSGGAIISGEGEYL